jgi:segregation and condensation protein B
MNPDDLAAVVGAILFASGEAVPPKEIAAAVKDVSVQDVRTAIETLEQQYSSNQAGLRLEWVAGGVRLCTRPEVADWVRQFFRQRHRTRLSPAALETLAIVAYRQPVTAPEIQAIRGKDPQGPLKNLLEKKLLKLLGKKKVVGNPLLYGTSKEFLVHFGLNTLSDLPSMEEFDRFVGGLENVDIALDEGESANDEPQAADGADADGSQPPPADAAGPEPPTPTTTA